MSIGRIEIIDGIKQYVEYAGFGGTECISNSRVGNVKDLSLEKSPGNLTLTWKDPDDVVFNGNTIAKWAGTKVVRKIGSPPTNIKDGVLIADNRVKDQYSSVGFQDADLVENTEYNYVLFPYTTKDIYTLSDLNRVSGSPGYNPILSKNTWKTIHDASVLGIAKDLWSIGDEKDGFQILAFDHDDLADGSGKAGITFEVVASKNTMKSAYCPYSTNTYYNYVRSTSKTVLDTDIYDMLADDLKVYIKEVNKKVSNVVNSSEIYSVSIIPVKLFMFALGEIYSVGEKVDNIILTQSSGYYKEGEVYEGITKEFFLDGKKTDGWTRTIEPSPLDSKKMWYFDTYGYKARRSSGVTAEYFIRYGFCI